MICKNKNVINLQTMDKDFYLKRRKNLLWLREEREKAWGWTEEGKIRDKDQYRKNRVKGLVERRDKGLEGHVAWD